MEDGSLKLKNSSPPASLKWTVTTPLKLSEDPEKVAKAIKNAVGAEVTIIEDLGRLIAKGDDAEGLKILYNKIRDKQIVNAARRRLLENTFENSTWLYLNKQAAYAETLNICDDESESPLGPIQVTIYSKNIESIIDWLAPRKDKKLLFH